MRLILSVKVNLPGVKKNGKVFLENMDFSI